MARLEEQLERVSSSLKKVKARASEYMDQFGAESHEFRMLPPASEEKVAVFETKHAIKLPEPYRAFITTITEGGPGPYYGLLPLDRADDLETEDETTDFLKTECLLKTDVEYEWGWNDEDETPEPFVGVQALVEQGCGIYCGLVVSGEARGRVVYVSLGFEPPFFVHDSNFLDWYERWLDELLEGLNTSQFGFTRGGTESELLPQLEMAATDRHRADILVALGRRPIREEATKAAVLSLLNSSSSDLRRAALWAVASLSGDHGDTIAHALEDREKSVREQAVHTLVKTEAVVRFADQLNVALKNEGDTSAMFSMANALSRVSRLDSRALSPHAHHPEEGRRRYAAHFLKELGGPSSLIGYEHLLLDEDIHVRIYAEEAYRKAGPRECIRLLQGRADDPNRSAPETGRAIEALQALLKKDHDSSGLLARLARWAKRQR